MGIIERGDCHDRSTITHDHSIVATEPTIRVGEQILDQRADSADENPESLIPADEVFANLRARLKAS